MMTATWAPIPGWEGLYEASDQGEIRSLDRMSFGAHRPGRVLKPSSTSKGYRIVVLCRDAVRTAYPVHRLVAEAFLGPMPAGMQTRHLDDDKTNNAAANLAYGTRAENEADKVRNGLAHPNAAKTHCPQGHEYSPENTREQVKDGRVSRSCKTCHRKRKAAYVARLREASIARAGLLQGAHI